MKKTNDSWLNDLRRERLQSSSRNPGAAALMSFFVMGMGQIYAGHIDRGIMLMGFQFTGIFAGYSLYSNGIVYETLYPYLGAHLIVMASYVVSVFFILLWIYNIKDAYYLSLFSSFRDWFEVERVLLPVLKEQASGLLAGPAVDNELLADSSDERVRPVEAPETAAADYGKEAGATFEPVASSTEAMASSADDAEEADVLEFRIDRKTQPKKLEKRREEEKSEAAHVVSGRDFDAISGYGSSWKLYAGLIIIFVLVGIWFNNQRRENLIDSASEETLFSVSAEMGKPTQPAAKIVSRTIDKPVDEQTDAPVSGKDEPVTDQISTSPADDVPAMQAEEPPFIAALALARQGDLTAATSRLTADLQRAQPSEAVWKEILSTFYRADDKVAYELHLRRYLKTYEQDAAAWFNLGKLLYDREELAQAAQALASGLKADPDNVRGNFLLGSIYSDLKLYEDSALYLTRAVNLEPLNLEFNRMLARSLAAAGKQQEAVKYYQRVSSLAPDDQEARQAVVAARSSIDSTLATAGAAENQVLVVMGKNESRLIEKNKEEGLLQPVGKVLFERSELDEDEPSVVVEDDVEASEIEPQPAVATTVSEKVADAESVSSADTPREEKTMEPVTADAATPAEAVKKQSMEELAPSVPSASTGVVIASPAESGLSVLEVAASSNIAFRDAVAQPKAKPPLQPQQQSSLQPKSAPPQKKRIEEFRQKGSYEFSRGNWEAALPHYLNILKEKQDPQTYDIVGLIFEKLSMHEDAFDAIEHAYKLGMRDAATLAKLGRLAEINGAFKKGEYYLYHALQKVPHRIDLRIRYARCLVANGREQIALKELNKIVRASGDSYAVRRRAELEIQKIKSRKQ